MVAGVKVKQEPLGKSQASIHSPRVIHSLPLQTFADARLESISANMEGDRIAQALARIEAASNRIEAAAKQRTGSDPQLQVRYDRLRGEANAALAEVEALIEDLSS